MSTRDPSNDLQFVWATDRVKQVFTAPERAASFDVSLHSRPNGSGGYSSAATFTHTPVGPSSWQPAPSGSPLSWVTDFLESDDTADGSQQQGASSIGSLDSCHNYSLSWQQQKQHQQHELQQRRQARQHQQQQLLQPQHQHWYNNQAGDLNDLSQQPAVGQLNSNRLGHQRNMQWQSSPGPTIAQQRQQQRQQQQHEQQQQGQIQHEQHQQAQGHEQLVTWSWPDISNTDSASSIPASDRDALQATCVAAGAAAGAAIALAGGSDGSGSSSSSNSSATGSVSFLQACGLLLAVTGGLIALLQEMTDAALTAYNNSIKPTVQLMWWLAGFAGGLIWLLLTYLLLPLSKLLLWLSGRLVTRSVRLVQYLGSRVSTAVLNMVPAQISHKLAEGNAAAKWPAHVARPDTASSGAAADSLMQPLTGPVLATAAMSGASGSTSVSAAVTGAKGRAPATVQTAQQHITGVTEAARPNDACSIRGQTLQWPNAANSGHHSTAAAAKPAQGIHNISVPAYFLCPITANMMIDPVVACDGYTYERGAITKWLQVSAGACRSPMTNKPMKARLVPNHSLRSSIMEWKQQTQRAD